MEDSLVEDRYNLPLEDNYRQIKADIVIVSWLHFGGV